MDPSSKGYYQIILFHIFVCIKLNFLVTPRENRFSDVQQDIAGSLRRTNLTSRCFSSISSKPGRDFVLYILPSLITYHKVRKSSVSTIPSSIINTRKSLQHFQEGYADVHPCDSNIKPRNQWTSFQRKWLWCRVRKIYFLQLLSGSTSQIP